MAQDEAQAVDAKLDGLLETIRSAARDHLRKQEKSSQAKQQSTAAQSASRIMERTRQMDSAEQATEALALNALESALMSLGLLELFTRKEHEQNDAESGKASDLDVVGRVMQRFREREGTPRLEGGVIDIEADRQGDRPQLERSPLEKLGYGEESTAQGLPGQGPLDATQLGVSPLPAATGPGAVGTQTAGASTASPAAGQSASAASSASVGAGAAAGGVGAVVAVAQKVGDLVKDAGEAIESVVGMAANEVTAAESGSAQPKPLPERTGPDGPDQARYRTQPGIRR